MKRYIKACSSLDRLAMKERMDCSVIATSIVCRTTYAEAHKTQAMFGRKNRKGTYNSNILAGVKSLGFSVEPVKRIKQKNGSKYTPKTIGEKLKTGYYLCFCRGHVFAVVNGDVEDWTEGRKHHITEIYKVKRTRLK